MVRTWVRKRLRDDWPLLLLAFACVLFAMAFTELAGHVMEGNFRPLDRAMRAGTVQTRPDVLVGFFRAVSYIGQKEWLVALCAVAGWFLFPRNWAWPALLIGSAVATREVVNWLKRSYEITRPPFGDLASSSLSFPSGHASGAAAILVFFAYVAVRHRRHPWLVASAAALLTLLVGVSRIYLDYHWASDVIGGWIVGAAFGAAFAALYEWVLRHQRRRAPTESVPSGPGRT